MKAIILAFVLAAGFAGCSTQPSTSTSGASGAPNPSGATNQQVQMCQTFRSYERQASQSGEYKEACIKQLGADLCAKCLASGL
jgi:hypothetical protein